MRLGGEKELPVLSGSHSLFLVALKGWLFPKKAPVPLSVCSHRHWFGFQSPLFYLSADSSLLTSLESQIFFISLCLEPFPRGSAWFIAEFELWFAVITPFSFSEVLWKTIKNMWVCTRRLISPIYQGIEDKLYYLHITGACWGEKYCCCQIS